MSETNKTFKVGDKRGYTKPVKRKVANVRNHFGNFITRRRIELNISNHEFGVRCRVATYKAFKWESGEEMPKLTSLRKIARGLEVGLPTVRKEVALAKMYRILHDYGFISSDKPEEYVIKVMRKKTGNGRQKFKTET